MNLEKLPLIGQAISRRRDEQVQRVLDSLPPVKTSEKGEKLFDILGGVLDIPNSGLSNETTISNKLLQANKEWVYRNNDVIAMEVSKMDFELYQLGLKDGEIVYNEVDSHPLLDLLDKPNSETTKSDALYIIQSHKKLTGDAFWLKIRSGKTTVALRSLAPDKIKLKLRDPTEKDPSVIEGFIYKDTLDGKEIEITYKPEEIIHIKKPDPNKLFRGYGAVEALAETIDVDNLTNLTTKNFFRKGAITNFVLSTDQKIQPEQIKRIQAEMKQMYGGAQNAYRTLVLGGGMKPEKLTFSNKDMEFLAQLAWYRDKIMTGFGNTLASLGMLDDVNRATHESSMIEWKRNSIKPDMDSIINALNEFLVPEFGSNLVLGYKDPIPEDRTDDIAEATELYSGGIIMRNEARELVGYESVNDGDVFNVGAQTIEEPGGGSKLDDEETDNEISDIEDEEGEGTKIYRSRNLRLRKRLPSEVPLSLVHFDYKAMLRRRGIYLRLRHNKELKDVFKPVVEKLIKDHKKKGKTLSIEKALEIAMKQNDSDYQPPHHSKFSADEIMNYVGKQLHSVEVIEEHFQEAVINFLKYVNSKVFDRLEAEIESKKSAKAKKNVIEKWNTKDVFDDFDTDFHSQAQLDFTPLLENLAVVAGQEAYSMVDVKDPYLPSQSLKSRVANNVAKFTGSMLDTDRNHITNIIADGVENGKSVVEIRSELADDFDFTKMQASRITQTEVLRASNQSALDAWKQSGVVEGKQWVTAGADDECADYEGQIEMLDNSFYDSGNEFQDGDPPIHPNCKCTVIPILSEVSNPEEGS